MSANLIVDIGNTCLQEVSIIPPPLLSGGVFCAASGTVATATGLTGLSVDGINADTYCNLCVAGVTQSGQLRIAVQCSDTDVSGNYTDPTSGLPTFPGAFQSGGILWLNSGGAGGGLLGAFVSGQSMYSGFTQYQGFQRPQRFVRANVISEGSAQFAGPLTVSFVMQNKTTGSGGGYTQAPQTGPGGSFNYINV